MLLKNLDKALVEGKLAQERYPESEHVWCALANVRLLQGLPFQEHDVPVSLKNDADALQFVAEAKLKAGNLEEAVHFSQKAASHPEAGFWSRKCASNCSDLRNSVSCKSYGRIDSTRRKKRL